ncbi:NAD(P)/FAD-dependent oxidoreductase [Blastococcus sp. KM273128]|uniref:phytoene desaturase family protein n=1 Tax=Blastococcus sp. KM273128 TaxID=2570314 RepID=UPI001F246102|nr:NAD(P)/FAD-dependent oxidoreductase [Blastococcus sp. KM273128]MCF6745874.1 NAD(P)/FAD-dependent oxidoreductase [Blastococcus sp. KM273128]
MAAHDVVIIGSGINSLVAGATLARAGRDVGIYERAPRLGGAIRTETDTPAPGFTTDLFSCWHPLFVGGPAYPSLADDLAARGVVYRNTDLPAAAALRDGSTAVLSTDADATAADFDRLSPGDGDAWRSFLEDFGSRAGIAFGALGTELFSLDGLKLAGQAVRQLGPRGLQQFGAEGLESARTWLSGTFDSPTVHGLLSPWVGHEGLGPDDALSGFINKVIALALAQGGCPVPEGGGVRLVEALAGIVTDAGGTTRTGADVVAVQTSDGRATGVRLADGEVVTAREAVLASVTPQQLYLELLDGVAAVPDRVREAARGFRYGRGDMQIHLALSEPPRWAEDHDRLSRAAIVHVSDGLDSVSRAVNEAQRHQLPVHPTIVAGQPAALDPTRVPDGAGALWLQLQETPGRPTGDAAGSIDVGDGTWTEELRERYADRVVKELSRHVTNLDSALIARRVLSPADLQSWNRNLVGGDPYAGACTIDQFLLWRPTPQTRGHRTAVDGLWHIGASTHPGPGLGGASGLLAAQHVLEAARPGLLATGRRMLGR